MKTVSLIVGDADRFIRKKSVLSDVEPKGIARPLYRAFNARKIYAESESPYF